MRGAEAISVETAVATAHPDWDTTQVAAEVQRIYAETNLDVVSRARVMLGGDPTESLMDQLQQIPKALASTAESVHHHPGPPGCPARRRRAGGGLWPACRALGRLAGHAGE